MKKRFLSLIIALAMMVGVFTPLIASAAEDNKVTNTVTLHKILMSKDNLSNEKFPGEVGLNNEKYDGNQVKDIKGYFGQDAKGAEGVFFALKFAKDYADKTKQGKYVKAKTELGEIQHDKPDYEIKVVDGKVIATPKATDDIKEAVSGLTDANGEIKFYTRENKLNVENKNYDQNDPESKAKLNAVCYLNGKFVIVEDLEKSTHKGDKGEVITDNKAVPVEITLPLVNNDGVVEDAHVYPKNMEEAPKIDKNFAKDSGLEAADGFDSADKSVLEENKNNDKTNINDGAQYSNYEKKKATAKAEIGKKIPYEVKTEIPAKSNLKEAHWDDKMTEGLTFNKDLEVTVGETKLKAEQYTLVQDNRGFSLKLNEKGLGLINGKDAAVTVTLKYSATVNSKAIADIPEANDIKFFYGNNPSEGNTPLPTKPNDNGEVKVEKTWDDGKWADGESATFKLVDANTGDDVTADDLVQGKGTKEEFEAYKASFNGTVELKKGKETATHTWKYLNKDKQYKAVEIASTTPSDAEYTEAKDGTIKVTDHKRTNPKPLNPTEPKVVTGGKRFVKTNQDGTERLAGAEFYVKNAQGKYLVADQKDASKVTKAKELYLGLIAAYNNAIEKATGNTAEEKEKSVTVKNPLYKDATTTPNEKENLSGKTEINKKIEELRLAYEKAFKENATAYKWEDNNDNAVVLVSDGEGRFEITGLEYGSYKLEEKEAPKGFAKLNKDEKQLEFTVAKGSYAGDAKEFKYQLTLKEGETQNYGQQIKNKKVTIPQTGGIGTIIFTAIGLAIMASAVIAIKKRQATEAR